MIVLSIMSPEFESGESLWKGEKVVLKGRAALRSFRKSECQRDFQTGILGIS